MAQNTQLWILKKDTQPFYNDVSIGQLIQKTTYRIEFSIQHHTAKGNLRYEKKHGG